MIGNATGPASQVKTVSAFETPKGKTSSAPRRGPPPATPLKASASTESCAVRSRLRSTNRTTAATVNTISWTVMPRCARAHPRASLRQVGVLPGPARCVSRHASSPGVSAGARSGGRARVGRGSIGR